MLEDSWKTSNEPMTYEEFFEEAREMFTGFGITDEIPSDQ